MCATETPFNYFLKIGYRNNLRVLFLKINEFYIIPFKNILEAGVHLACFNQ